MYSGRGFREWEIGDIDVIKVGDTYHLFHLVLPNHDYIAHATSSDCINWKRVKNALFVGDPGEWDDDMLWTMNVIRLPEGGYEMFYTGLSARENGALQRLGRAVSDDLFNWTKANTPPFPIEPRHPYYETLDHNGRGWVSFRDPFPLDYNGKRYLLACARIPEGPVSRRGCVGVVRLEQGKAIIEKPLFTPFVYDDVECPCLVEIKGMFYLIGSIREDVKVHYWHSDDFQGPYEAFQNNVLMPRGNYAARVTRDDGHILLYSFYVAGKNVEVCNRYFCPPKELAVDESGRLVLKSFHRWNRKISDSIETELLSDWLALFQNPSADMELGNPKAPVFTSKSGYEVFCFENPNENFIWRGRINVVGLGKCGIYFNGTHDGDGYFISLDVVNGFVQIRAWAQNLSDPHHDYVFENYQTNNFTPNDSHEHDFELIRYGEYIEFSIDGTVVLSLVNGSFAGASCGVYCESASVSLKDSSIHRLRPPDDENLVHFYQHSEGGENDPGS